jgi:hypothetical protein
MGRSGRAESGTVPDLRPKHGLLGRFFGPGQPEKHDQYSMSSRPAAHEEARPTKERGRGGSGVGRSSGPTSSLLAPNLALAELGAGELCNTPGVSIG